VEVEQIQHLLEQLVVVVHFQLFQQLQQQVVEVVVKEVVLQVMV
tara:strand:- start:434 stop:565 length:132 start_codon:yes stop_codon:yes gene_type:complete